MPRPKKFLPVFVLLLIGIFLVLSGVRAQQETFDLQRIERATVYVIQSQTVGNTLYTRCIGSGTLVSRDGLVLTNAHNTLVSESCPGDTLIVALSIEPQAPPVPKFRAEIVQANAGLDLALLRITRELNGRLIEAGTLAFPFVELGDSSTVNLDETVIVAGYPGIGDDPVTTARGTVTGFFSEPNGNPAWIKTSAVIPGTVSGGGAYNQAGQLIGVSTTAPVIQNAACLPIQDTNGDDLVNNSDFCIRTGGFINALRPSNFARPLLRAASLGLLVETPASSAVSSPTGEPTFKRLFFAPAVNEAGMPTSVIGSLPAGSNSLYLFFDYENMTAETVYELRVTINGEPSPVFSLAPVRWSGGERGMWYIGSGEQVWPNGVYEFTLFANGIAAPATRLTIGAAPETRPTFSDITFGLLDARGAPLGNGFVLPAGNTTASARFIYRNMQDGMEWSSIWYLNGVEIPNSRQTNVWAGGPSGTAPTSVQAATGLPPGSYRLELYIRESGVDRLAATSDFIIAGAQQGAFPEVFRNTHFTTAGSVQEAVTAAPISNLSNRVNTLYALFDWQQIATGTLWTMRWSVDNEVFYQQTVPWSTGESGENFVVALSSLNGITDGTYQIDLLLNNVLLGSATAQVGIGQLPLDRFAQASGIVMRGQIIDADTGKGIPGVTFVLISKDFSVEEFTATWSQEQVYALAITDSSGYFEVDRPLEFSTQENPVAYSALIATQGYLPISADGLEVTTETENPLNLVIELTRD